MENVENVENGKDGLGGNRTQWEGGEYMSKVRIETLPDVLDAKDVASVLGIGYVKALKLMRYGGMNSMRIGRVYRIYKDSFIYWLSCTELTIIDLD